VWALVITIPGDSILGCPSLTTLRWEPRRSGVRVALVDASMRPANIGKLLYWTRGSLKKNVGPKALKVGILCSCREHGRVR
jgi:hypothetical protein